jgi:hypothetical protein
LKPQQVTVPPTRTAHACSRPAAIAIASPSPCTPTGAASNRPAENPPGVGSLPSWPNELRPQHRTLPVTRSAHVKSCPEAIEATSVRPLTRPWAGSVTSGENGPPAPLPICPNWLRPTHCTSPSARSAHLCEVPGATVSVRVKPLTAAGVSVLSQHTAVPSARRAHVSASCAEIDRPPIVPALPTTVGMT